MLLHQQLLNYNVILGSGSPRRREILSTADLPFTVADPYHVDELYPEKLPVALVPTYLSQLKSNGYPKQLSDSDILITADTVVILSGRLIGKPKAGEAARTLELLSGKTHTVTTGVTLRSASKIHSFDNTSTVKFAELSTEQIDYYVERYAPYDKAGAYGIQEWVGCVAIESITGSFYNVMGLPIQQLCQELKNFIQ